MPRGVNRKIAPLLQYHQDVVASRFESQEAASSRQYHQGLRRYTKNTRMSPCFVSPLRTILRDLGYRSGHLERTTRHPVQLPCSSYFQPLRHFQPGSPQQAPSPHEPQAASASSITLTVPISTPSSFPVCRGTRVAQSPPLSSPQSRCHDSACTADRRASPPLWPRCQQSTSAGHAFSWMGTLLSAGTLA